MSETSRIEDAEDEGFWLQLRDAIALVRQGSGHLSDEEARTALLYYAHLEKVAHRFGEWHFSDCTEIVGARHRSIGDDDAQRELIDVIWATSSGRGLNNLKIIAKASDWITATFDFEVFEQLNKHVRRYRVSGIAFRKDDLENVFSVNCPSQVDGAASQTTTQPKARASRGGRPLAHSHAYVTAIVTLEFSEKYHETNKLSKVAEIASRLKEVYKDLDPRMQPPGEYSLGDFASKIRKAIAEACSNKPA